MTQQNPRTTKEPIAETRALADNPGNKRDKALERLLNLQSTAVNEPVSEVIAKGCQIRQDTDCSNPEQQKSS